MYQKNFTSNFDVLKSIPLGEYEEQRIQKSCTPKIFRPMTGITILALQSVSFEKDKSQALSLSLEMEDGSHQKVMEILTPKGYLLDFLTKF